MKFANSAAKKLGKIASVRTFPIANTSNPNNVPAKGVPNTERSVFGTPLAGTLFGLEVLAIGKVRTEAIFPSFFAALFANFMTESYGVSHLHYQMGVIPEWSMLHRFCSDFPDCQHF